MAPVGGSAAKPPGCQSVPTAPNGASDLVLRNVNSGALEVYDIANNQLTGAMPANCQSKPTVPRKAAPVSWLLLMS